MLTESTSEQDPDIALAFCDYRCSAEKCSDKFRFMRRWSFLPTILARPFRADNHSSGRVSFFCHSMGRGHGEKGQTGDFSIRICYASFVICSPSWAVSPSDPLFKVARVQKMILEKDHAPHAGRSLASSVGWSGAHLSDSFHRIVGIRLGEFETRARMCRTYGRSSARTDLSRISILKRAIMTPRTFPDASSAISVCRLPRYEMTSVPPVAKKITKPPKLMTNKKKVTSIHFCRGSL